MIAFREVFKDGICECCQITVPGKFTALFIDDGREIEPVYCDDPTHLADMVEAARDKKAIMKRVKLKELELIELNDSYVDDILHSRDKEMKLAEYYGYLMRYERKKAVK